MTEKKYRIGIDLGGTNIKAGIVDNDNNIICKGSVLTRAERSYQEIIADMGALVMRLLEESEISLGECEKIGVGSPGTVDAKTGVVVYSNNFGWENVPFTEELKKYIQLPIYISNDANCAALGEAVAGAAKGCDNVVMITLGTGVGGGVVIDGRIFEGGHAGGMELGHTVIEADGQPCTCGRKGCFEAYASATALIREAREAAAAHPESVLNELCGNDLTQMDGKMPFDAAQAGDETAKCVVDDYIRYLGIGIVDMINIFRPDKVLLSGGVCNQGEYLTAPLQTYAKKYCFAGEKAYVPEILRAELGNDAGLLGAASLS